MNLSYEVIERQDGSADIDRQRSRPSAAMSQGMILNIAAEHRVPVALALLGQMITDEMLRRAGEAFFLATWGETMENAKGNGRLRDKERPAWEAKARRVLEAALLGQDS